MAFVIPDVWEWITNLPPISQWTRTSFSLPICSSSSSHKPSLSLSITRSSIQSKINPFVSISLSADFNISISLWTSNPIHLKSNISSHHCFDQEELSIFLHDIVNGVLKYGPCKNSKSPKFHIKTDHQSFREIFNLAFLTLVFLVCIYEAPDQDLRHGCLSSLSFQMIATKSIGSLKVLFRVIGSNMEEKWMRSINLAVTNWISELKASDPQQIMFFKTPSPLLISYASSTSGLWKVQVYCPVIAMIGDEMEEPDHDERLLFSLRYQQLEGVIQLAYKVIVKENWIDIAVSVDNIRCDVNSLVSETLMAERGYGSEEKHFPSRISLQLTPVLFQSDVLSVTVSKSSDNPIQEVGQEKAIEASFEPPSSYLGLNFSVAETVTMIIKPWKFEQTVYGDSAGLNWYLHDGVNGKEVSSSRPSKLAFLQPRAWFRDRYSRAYRPFTKQGGVIFAGDEYGEKVWWKVSREAMGKTMEWEIKGWIWVTYWPNKQRSFYTETRKVQFKDRVYLHLPNAP